LTIIVFDVNETLLDISHMDPIFEDLFGSGEVRKEWFSQVIQDALVSSLIDRYSDFGKIGVSAFELIAARKGVKVGEDDFSRVVAAMRSLPAHAEVSAQLQRLKDHGFQLVTLTNSPPALVAAQLDNAGISKFFDQQLSVDSVKTFKPAPKVYEFAASELNQRAADLWLVAAHNWDTSGALAAGWNAAFIARHGMNLSRLDQKPQIIGSSLVEVADALISQIP
jgi:2-haloacid dehalogenase